MGQGAWGASVTPRDAHGLERGIFDNGSPKNDARGRKTVTLKAREELVFCNLITMALDAAAMSA